MTVTFQHRFDFEITGPIAFDGGVIEVSTDNGTTWQDISTLASPGYNVTLTAATNGNVLAGRPAFGGKNASNPATDTVTLNLGTALAGKTFRLRFRIGTDAIIGGGGWEVDNVAFTGIVGTPFPTLVPDPGHCAAVSPPGTTTGNDPGDPGNDHPPGADGGANDDGGCQAGGSVGAGALLGLAAVLLRRRRR